MRIAGAQCWKVVALSLNSRRAGHPPLLKCIRNSRFRQVSANPTTDGGIHHPITICAACRIRACDYLAVLFRHCLSRSGAAAQLQRQVSNLKNEEPMRKHLSRILMVAALTGSVALAQGTSPQSTSPSGGQQSTTSPTQAQPGTPGQASTTPSA